MSDNEWAESIRRMLDLDYADVVPPHGLTREAIDGLANAREVTVQIPGELLTDADGMPLGVEEPTETDAEIVGVIITKSEAERLGINPKEYPNVRIVE